jgi:hypothetical protein
MPTGLIILWICVFFFGTATKYLEDGQHFTMRATLDDGQQLMALRATLDEEGNTRLWAML